MTNLLVITDVPRLRKVFLRLADDHAIRLRVASSLEKGGEEIVADKPAMVFVQTHLSGLSADILLMHLKKLLGRRRTRFVLLSPPDQISRQVLKLYNGHIDSSLDDQSLSATILETISTLTVKKKKAAELPPTTAPDFTDNVSLPDGEPIVKEPLYSGSGTGDDPLQRDLSDRPVALPLPGEPEENAPELTLEEQGIVYASRPPIQVYSEFTSSFDTAVTGMVASENFDEPLSNQAIAGMYDQFESSVPPRAKPRSKVSSFLLWLVLVVVIVVVVTVLQYRSTQPPPVDVAATPSSLPAAKPPAVVNVPLGPKKLTPVPLVPQQKPVVRLPASAPDARMTDRGVLSATAEKSTGKVPVPAASVKNRLRSLPVFIPRTGFDKAYSAANPGWERYKGVVTEFKVFREGESIKAIQVIDRGGRGVPDAFMKGVLQQLTKTPSHAIVSSVKKDGYEIQRGQVADNLKVIYYRDADGGRLRAFVLTWQ